MELGNIEVNQNGVLVERKSNIFGIKYQITGLYQPFRGISDAAWYFKL